MTDERELVAEPELELCHDGLALLLTNGPAHLGIAAADLIFDAVERKRSFFTLWGCPLRLPVPGRELVDAAVEVSVDEAGQDVIEVGNRVHLVQLAALDQRREDGPVLSTVIGSGEERVLAVECDRPHRPFDRVRIELDVAVVDEQHKPIPARQHIADRLGDHGTAWHLAQMLAEEAMEFVEHRTAALATRVPTPVGQLPADLPLNAIELCNQRQHALRSRGGSALGEVEELAACVGPAMGEDYVVTPRRKRLVGGISVGLQHPGKALEQRGRMFGPAARRIGVGHGRRVGASPSSLVLGYGPEVAALRLAASRLQHGRLRLVDEQPRRRQEPRADVFPERLQLSGRIACPVSER